MESDNGKELENEINYEQLYKDATAQISELTAERDSLLAENGTLRTERDTAIADGAKAREMNYTLSRQLNLQQDVKKEPEECIYNMFLNREGKT